MGTKGYKMIRLSANIDWLWKELPLDQRLKAAASAGFRYVESLNPYAASIEDWKRGLRDNRLSLALINTPSGSSAEAKVRGLAAWSGKEPEFQKLFHQALTYALALDVPLIHATAGPVAAAGSSEAAQQITYEKNLAWACETAHPCNILVTIEPLSPRDAPGAFMASLLRAKETLTRVNHPALKIQFDLYHQQILHGDIITNLRLHKQDIGHIQVAGVPDRTEPDRGELDFARIAQELVSLGYNGTVGCEYRPASTPEAGLGWARPYL
jgi:hydroxypyruvate isomerase